MKNFFRPRILALLAAGLAAVCPRAGAQFELSVTSSASSVLVSNAVTFTINVTNLTGNLLTDTIVTDALPVSVPVLSVQVSNAAVNNYAWTNYGNVVRFDLYQFQSGGSAQLVVIAEPTAAGFITNTATVTAIGLTNTASVVVQVTNAPVLQADLGVAIVGPSQTVITNDWMTYGVTATNSGPNNASGVALTNTLPPGVGLKSVFPTNQTYSTAGSNLIFNLGTVTNGGGANLQFTVQPTNAGVLVFSASIGSSNVFDPNPANNTASTNITVIGYLSGLMAFTNSAQSTNFVSGLLEQTIIVSNTGPSAISAARVVVTGLTNRLFNAVGTNNGNPYVVYDSPPSAPLTNGQSVSLLLQYFPRKSFPFTNSQLQAFAVPVPNWTPPPATGTSTNLTIARIIQLPNGNMLIEWPAITNRIYTVVYSDNILFSNAMVAPPSIVAPANDVEWIDYGPPTTVSAPTNSSVRFYRVLLNP
jgi:uncharacterized repeat protein (TIGR01451 family)